MKSYTRNFCIALLFLFLISSCKQTESENPCPEQPKNEVLVMGMIHSGHLTDSVYTTAYVEKID